jgi:membrane protein DedA with SNARE-associated domain
VIQSGLSGVGAVWLILLSLAVATFVLEDAAIAAGAALAAHGTILWIDAFCAVAGGIALGDLGLYGLGLAARSVPWLHRRYISDQPNMLKESLEPRLWSAVLLARVIPGLRLVTYTVCGFARVRLLSFCLAVVMAVALWTAGLFWFTASLGAVIAEQFHVSVPIAVALPIIAIAIFLPAIRWMRLRISK